MMVSEGLAAPGLRLLLGAESVMGNT
jgi:hypothetical protein